VNVRDAALGDVPAMARIYDHFVETSVATFDTEPRGLDVLTAKVEHADQSDHVLVALENEQVVGYATSGPFRPRPAYGQTKETSVYVHPAHTGAGVGRALYSVLLARLDQDATVHTQVSVIALPNSASEALHLALGFERVGTLREVGHKQGRYVDVLYMQRISPQPR